jgi:hypothetical protein
MLVVWSGNLRITAGLPTLFSLVTWVVFPNLSHHSNTMRTSLLMAEVILLCKKSEIVIIEKYHIRHWAVYTASIDLHKK